MSTKKKILGWNNATFHVNAFQMHGTGPTAFVGNQYTISNIEALPAIRIYELWIEQEFWHKHLTLRVGQMAADGDFLASETASLFLNGTFGWPGILAVNLPAGGPAYPLATPGVRANVLAGR